MDLFTDWLKIAPAKLDTSLMKEPRMIHGVPRVSKTANNARRKPLPKLMSGLAISPPWGACWQLQWSIYSDMTRVVKHSSSTGPPRTSPGWFVAKIKFVGSDVQCAMVQTTSRNTARFTMLLIFFGYVLPCTIPDLAAGCPIQASWIGTLWKGGRKEKERKPKKKKMYRSNFGISTAQHIRVEFLKKI